MKVQRKGEVIKMKTRIFVATIAATAFIAASISVGAATMNKTSAKNLYNAKVRTEVSERLMERAGVEYDAYKDIDTLSTRDMDRARLQDCEPDCDRDQARARLQDCEPECDQNQARTRLQACEPDCDQEQVMTRSQEMKHIPQPVQTQEAIHQQEQTQAKHQEIRMSQAQNQTEVQIHEQEHVQLQPKEQQKHGR